VAVHGSNVYVAGFLSGTFPGQVNAGGPSDAFLRAYDTDGNELWTRQFGSAALDAANSIAADDTAVYVGGETDGVLPGQTSAGGRDAFVRKYDLVGNEIWTRQFGSANGFQSTDTASSIAVDASGVFVAGTAQFALPGQAIGGAFVRKYDGNGTEL